MDEKSKSPAIGWQLFQSVTTVGAVIFIVTSLLELADYFVRKDSVLRTRLAKMDFNDGSLSFEAWFSMKKHTMASNWSTPVGGSSEQPVLPVEIDSTSDLALPNVSYGYLGHLKRLLLAAFVLSLIVLLSLYYRRQKSVAAT